MSDTPKPCGRTITSGSLSYACAGWATDHDDEGNPCCPLHARESLKDRLSALRARIATLESSAAQERASHLEVEIALRAELAEARANGDTCAAASLARLKSTT